MNLFSLDPTAWRRISPYLDQVLDLQPDAREAWLAELAATQPVIGGTLREMLATLAVADAAGFLEGSPSALVDLAATDQVSTTGRESSE